MIPIIAGAMGLAVLDAVVSRQSAASNLGGWFEGFANAVRAFLSPAVPAFNTGTTTPGPSTKASLAPAALSPAGTTTTTTTAPPGAVWL